MLLGVVKIFLPRIFKRRSGEFMSVFTIFNKITNTILVKFIVV